MQGNLFGKVLYCTSPKNFFRDFHGNRQNMGNTHFGVAKRHQKYVTFRAIKGKSSLLDHLTEKHIFDTSRKLSNYITGKPHCNFLTIDLQANNYKIILIAHY